ncbi:LuxR family transcriptional regulator [Streptomyces radicis]|uniref:LuxR family transcriptional regulator n=1 Tax=Streptomyces radicis TaxID=1750517 RepID=A0A3A9W3W7_9ACTN|nr:LuxR family transcriptional regulator [Streptomyces radicis]RKN19615.1 LuxR family transcriptional regulator [Streptomyces radicis]
MTPTGGSTAVLVERAKILEQLDDLLIRSARGSGAIAAVSGSTAMGKTTVLNALAERAVSAGSTVLSVVSSPHERDVPYGALAQLFHSIDARFPGAAVPGAQDDPLAVARGTHRVIAELAAKRHMLITVDDIQHTDAATLTCLSYLAQHLTQLPLALVFTHGVSVDEQPPRILHDLLYRASVRRSYLGPLTRDGIRELAEGCTATPATDRFVAEAHALSGGNPLLVQALIEEHRLRAAPEPGAGAVPRESEGQAAQPVTDGLLSTGHVFHQAVLACLHRLGPRAVRLARCVALLEGAATPLLMSRLSGIDTGLVERYLRLLTGIGVLDGVKFRRAGVQQAVLGEMPHDEATDLRHRAARLLYDSGASPRAVAGHLLDVGPLREDWVLPVLREAARHALADGDVQLGIRCLELARECCTEEAQRVSVKAQYASAQWQLRPAASAQHFLALKGPILAGTLKGGEALRVADGMLFHLDFDEALEAVNHLNDGNEDAATALHSTRLLMASEFPGVLDRLSRPLPPTAASATSTSELRARHALALVLERGADEYAIALAEQVLQGSQSRSPWNLKGLPAALLALCYADRLDAAAEWYERLVTDQERHYAPIWRAMLDTVGALISLRRGRLGDAVRQAEAAHERLSGPRWNVSGAMALAILVEAHTAMGNHRVAARYLAPEPPPELFLTRAGLHYLYARGRHHLATGNTYMALYDFMGCGALMRRWNIDTPSLAAWRLGEAETWLRLGDRERAVRLVEKQLSTPDTGLTRSRGMALHGFALVQATTKQPPILQDAFRLLESSGARYEAAAVLADLSRAYQRLGEKAKARPTAQRAWRLAKSCQAESMCQALLPSPLPRSVGTRESTSSSRGDDREARGGFGGLSKSERRVAMLASQGYANREIADRLFITVSTVEQHLTRVYRKMGIRNREQLLEEVQAVSYETV